MRLVYFIILIVISSLSYANNYRYDAKANPYELFSKSIAIASKENKLLLVVFGSDWCPDCRSLNEKLTMKPLSEIITKRFVVMHVDIGEWDKNIDFTKNFGDPIDGGIPSIAILGGNKKLYYVAEGGEFASARTSKVKTLNEWFVSLDIEITKLIESEEANKSLQPTAEASAE
jgi:thioredoxin 1